MARLLFFLLMLAAVVYAITWLLDQRAQRRTGPRPPGNGGSGSAGGPARRLPPGPIGPDDDEAFLRELDRRKRHRHDDAG